MGLLADTGGPFDFHLELLFLGLPVCGAVVVGVGYLLFRLLGGASGTVGDRPDEAGSDALFP